MVNVVMYQTTYTFITSHQVKEAFPFLKEGTKENQQRFIGVQGKIGKVDRRKKHSKLLNIKKPRPTEEASNFKAFGGLLSTKMKYHVCGFLFSHPSLGICFYILLEKGYQPRPVFGLT